jgi:hypothetical protein
MKFDNDEGLAYGFMMLILYFAAAGVIWLAWSWVIDIVLVTAINPSISEGVLSLQTVNSTAFGVNVLRYTPAVILVFGWIYGVNRGIFKRGGSS